MNIEELLEKIRLESQREIESHRQVYEEKMKKMREELEAKKGGLKKQENALWLREAEAEQRRLVSCEIVAWHKKLLEKKRAAVDEAIQLGTESFRKSKEYRRFLEKSIGAAEGKAMFFANKEDKIAREIIMKKNKKANIEPADFCAGIAFSSGGGKTIYTLEAYLEKNRARVESEISGILFECRA